MISDLAKHSGLITVIISVMGVGGYLSGMRPAWSYELAQTNKKLDDFACLQIVIEWQKAKAENNIHLIAYWTQQAQRFNCALPS